MSDIIDGMITEQVPWFDDVIEFPENPVYFPPEERFITKKEISTNTSEHPVTTGLIIFLLFVAAVGMAQEM